MSTQTLPCSSIQAGIYQPREYFDADRLAGLASSISSSGLLQPISVRPIGEGKYEIIAGERRWRAFQMIHGAEGQIPVIIREMSDDETRKLALIENIQREDMSPTEEAVAAGELVKIHKDKDQVAESLGWKLDKLERRLALLRCVDEVRNALNTRQIKLGHAELLATVEPEMQKKVLAGVLANNTPIATLKSQLANYAQKLDSAIFERDECAGCQYNSAMQSSLFAENIGDGSCTHPACFQEKTEAQLTTIVNDLKEEVPRVERLTVGDDQILTIRLVVDGNKGVGASQHTACQGCANYGATVATAPGRIGKVEKGLCFDSDCHTLKVAANIKSMAEAKALEREAANPQSSSSTPNAQQGAEGFADNPRVSSTTPIASASKESPSLPSKTSQRVVEYCEAEWRRVAYLFLKKNPGVSQRFLLWLAISSNIKAINSPKFREFYEKETKTQLGSNHNIGDQLSKVDALEDVQITKLIDALSLFCLKELEIRMVKGLLSFLDVRMSDYWKVTDKYLTLLTSSEIKVFCKESGLDVKAGESFDRIFQGKKSEIVAAVKDLAEKHLTGYVPKTLDYTL